jgi:hypothetical protein
MWNSETLDFEMANSSAADLAIQGIPHGGIYKLFERISSDFAKRHGTRGLPPFEGLK